MVVPQPAVIKVETITDNPQEKLTIKFDGERFALCHETQSQFRKVFKAIILNPREANSLIKFIRAVSRRRGG